MKLSPRAYAIVWDAHAWVGAIASVILFAVFFLGAFALFAEELSPWQEPDFRAPIAVDDETALAVAQRIADAEAAQRPAWFGISLPTEEEPWMRIWRLGDGGLDYSFVHPATGASFDQRSTLGDFLNEMHFLAPLPWGREIAGVASLVLLFLAGTGLAIQIGKVVRELVQFRPRGRQRRVLWSDAHKVIGVVALPFFLLFGFTGALFCLEDALEPAIVAALFDGDRKALSQVEEWPGPPPAAGVAAPAPDLAAAYRTATARFPDAEHRWFFIDHLGDANVSVDMPGEKAGRLAPYTNVRVDGSGAITWLREAGGANAYAATFATLYGLHYAGWADLGGKALYAILSVLAAFGILAGNLLWIERRRATRLGRFDRFLARATAGCCAGLPLAVAAIFTANQLLPADVAGRAGLEHATFFATWVAAMAWAFVAPAPQRVALRLLAAAGTLLLCVPFVDALRTGRLPFDPRAPWLLATEAGLALLALLLLAAAVLVGRLGRATPSPARKGTPAATEEAAPARAA